MGQIAGTNTATFNEDELMPEGTRHVKSLHICKMLGMIISRILIDKVSKFNVCPTIILSRIGVEDFIICPKEEFDGTK